MVSILLIIFFLFQYRVFFISVFLIFVPNFYQIALFALIAVVAAVPYAPVYYSAPAVVKTWGPALVSTPLHATAVYSKTYATPIYSAPVYAKSYVTPIVTKAYAAPAVSYGLFGGHGYGYGKYYG